MESISNLNENTEQTEVPKAAKPYPSISTVTLKSPTGPPNKSHVISDVVAETT
jgi:hypothetical protein